MCQNVPKSNIFFTLKKAQKFVFKINAKSAKMSNLTKKCYQIKKSAKKDQKDTKSDKKK